MAMCRVDYEGVVRCYLCRKGCGVVYVDGQQGACLDVVSCASAVCLELATYDSSHVLDAPLLLLRELLVLSKGAGCTTVLQKPLELAPGYALVVPLGISSRPPYCDDACIAVGNHS